MNGQRIGIAGTGLIGGSIALRARALGAFVTGYDRNPDAVGDALARGALDAAAEDLAALAATSDLLILAVPVDAAAAALESLPAGGGPRLIIDVASVKAPLRRFAARVRAYVGTHPMAGREISGVAASDPNLFANATWAHVPHPDPALVARVREFITAMGARPLEIDALRHDDIVALTSHLPQMLSVVLAGVLAHAAREDRNVIELCGPGIRSMLRLARSPAALWAPIVRANGAELARNMRTVAQALVAAADGLDRGDSAALMSYFESAHAVTGALEERFPPVSRS